MAIPFLTRTQDGRSTGTATYKGHRIEVRTGYLAGADTYPSQVYIDLPNGGRTRFPGPVGIDGVADTLEKAVQLAVDYIDGKPVELPSA